MGKLDDTLNRFNTARTVLEARIQTVKRARAAVAEAADHGAAALEEMLAASEAFIEKLELAQDELAAAEAAVKPAKVALASACDALHNLLPSVSAGLGLQLDNGNNGSSDEVTDVAAGVGG